MRNKQKYCAVPDPGSRGDYGWGGKVNRTDLHAVNGGQSAHVSSTATTPHRARHARDPGPGIEAGEAATTPPAGSPHHGTNTTLRRQPVRIVEGRAEGGYTDAFEIICCDCGDHPYLNYSQASSRLQKIRGPYTMAAGIAAYDKHLGIADLTVTPERHP